MITTVAGNGTLGFSGDGGPGSDALLDMPQSVDVDTAGSVYIADTGNNRVRRVTSEGVIQTIAGAELGASEEDGGLAVNTFIESPTRVAVDPLGNVFLAQAPGFPEGIDRIRKVDPAGTSQAWAMVGRRPQPLWPFLTQDRLPVWLSTPPETCISPTRLITASAPC